ncbi:MAG TPA: hypothetical protein VFV66_13730 [Nonomuraea sp.]|nr:hypothetical protein [Nonomuraea sp.]
MKVTGRVRGSGGRASVLQSGDDPLFARVIAESGRELVDPGERFAYGLGRLLDGIAADLVKDAR